MWSYCPAVPQGHSEKLQTVYACVCVCVGGGGGGGGGGRSINWQFTWMYYHCMMHEIRTALLYGERARAMYNSRCVNISYAWGRGCWYSFPPYLHTIVTNVCNWLNGVFLHTSIAFTLSLHVDNGSIDPLSTCRDKVKAYTLHWLSLVILKESHQKVPI